jgi:DNA mismatch endonuclease (patch repair protein)
VLPRFRVAVFVHGCFWHGHACSRGKRPTSNVEFWNSKIDRNIQRDQQAQRFLKASGWFPVIIWGCRLQSGTERLLKHLKAMRGPQPD